MEQLVEAKEFIENATFSGNMYGTSKTAVMEVGEEWNKTHHHPGVKCWQDLHPGY